MAKFLGKQISELDERPAVFDAKRVSALELKDITVGTMLALAEAPATEVDEVTFLVRQRMMVELVGLFWSYAEDIKSCFPGRSLEMLLRDADEEAFAITFGFIRSYLYDYIDEVDRVAAEHKDWGVPLLVADFSVNEQQKYLGKGSSNSLQHFADELSTGLLLCADFVELVHRCYELKFGRKMPLSAFKATLRSAIFKSIAFSLGRSSALGEAAFLRTVSEKNKEGRSCFDPQHFDLVERAGVFLPRMNDATTERVKRTFETGPKYGEKNTCPASRVQGDRSSVIDEFAAWVLDVYAEYYGPVVCEAD